MKKEIQRTLTINTLKSIGNEVMLQGWVHARRDHGKLMFLDLRDRSGIVQLVIEGRDENVKPESVIEVFGIVKSRPKELINPKISTGTVEVEVKSLYVLSVSKELPFPIDTDGYEIGEETRLKYRYIDLRRKRLQKNLRVRSKYVHSAREFLFSKDFVEIETPILTKSTPEGARDFIVPSRLHPGKFFALPQSPQQYKQLLMTAGFERYFQIARCLRDEDLRADRGFEHTQIDIEMSFVEREDVMQLVEEMTVYALTQIRAKIAISPFPVITYKDAIKKYGADKFDLRSEKEKKEGVLSFAWVIDFPFFEKDKEGNWTFTHNPFSQPLREHEKWLLEKKNIDKILTSQYDLVCNGMEVAGGSIRSHKREVLEKVFEIMGYGKEEIRKKFGHMLEAFTYGTPPHGGCAQGFERLLMAYLGEEYIREVQAFPQTGSGKTSVMDAPSDVSNEQLEELGISIIFKRPKIDEKIISELKKKNISHTVYEHAPVYTSEDAARIRKTDLSQGAKAILLYSDEKPVMVVVSGDRKIDFPAFKKLYKVKDLRMAKEEEVLSVTGVPIGAVPPFGHIFRIPLYMDTKLKEKKELIFNAGLHTKSIKMNVSDYISIANPIIGDFSKSV